MHKLACVLSTLNNLTGRGRPGALLTVCNANTSVKMIRQLRNLTGCSKQGLQVIHVIGHLVRAVEIT
jgi:hypothetical protein